MLFFLIGDREHEADIEWTKFCLEQLGHEVRPQQVGARESWRNGADPFYDLPRPAVEQMLAILSRGHMCIEPCILPSPAVRARCVFIPPHRSRVTAPEMNVLRGRGVLDIGHDLRCLTGLIDMRAMTLERFKELGEISRYGWKAEETDEPWPTVKLRERRLYIGQDGELRLARQGDYFVKWSANPDKFGMVSYYDHELGRPSGPNPIYQPSATT